MQYNKMQMEDDTVYKTEVIKNVVSVVERSKKMEALINKNELEGWTFVNAVSSPGFSVILTFKQNAERKPVENPKFDSKFFKAKINRVIEDAKN